MKDYLGYMVSARASDLLLKVGQPPVIRIDGALHHLDFPSMGPEDTEAAARDLLPAVAMEEFLRTHEADVGHTLNGVGRFRVNVFRQRGQVGLAIRHIRTDVPTLEELRLPPAAHRLVTEMRGLILVTGPAGTGKTTTIAAMIGAINRSRRAHIVTIEDPIEVLHEDVRCVVDQREIGFDTISYRHALRAVVRQDPDIIFIGEIRDVETAQAAIQAAETGHLVISTLHTLDAPEAVNRLIDLFLPNQQRQARVALASSLKGILSQRLVPRADGTGRVPAVEVLVNTGRVSERILDPERTAEIVDVMKEGEFYGMQTFDQSLVGLVHDGLVTEQEAVETATNPHDFVLALRAARPARPVQPA